MDESKKSKFNVKAFPYSDALFKKEIPWHQRGGFISTNDEVNTLIIGNSDTENVVYMLCDCTSVPHRILYVQTKLDYQNKGFAALLLEYFLEHFAKGVNVEASSPTSTSAEKLLQRFGFTSSGFWRKRKK